MLTRGAAAFLAGCAGAGPRSARAEARPVRVFAAASLAEALDEAAARWREEPSQADAPVSLSYAASSTLARQIELGAPADLFVSANLAWMAHLTARGAVAAETRLNLLANRLVLAAAPGREIGLDAREEIDGSIDLLRALGPEGRLATGRVKTVPLGIYAKAALVSLGLWESVASRLAEAENARVAYAYVARGEAPLGVLYASDLFGAEAAAPERRPRPIGLFPASSHPAILYPAALTPQGAANPLARDLLAFLASDRAAAIFEQRGFARPAP